MSRTKSGSRAIRGHLGAGIEATDAFRLKVEALKKMPIEEQQADLKKLSRPIRRKLERSLGGGISEVD